MTITSRRLDVAELLGPLEIVRVLSIVSGPFAKPILRELDAAWVGGISRA